LYDEVVALLKSTTFFAPRLECRPTQTACKDKRKVFPNSLGQFVVETCSEKRRKIEDACCKAQEYIHAKDVEVHSPPRPIAKRDFPQTSGTDCGS
jgi:hypothetical protein